MATCSLASRGGSWTTVLLSGGVSALGPGAVRICSSLSPAATSTGVSHGIGEGGPPSFTSASIIAASVPLVGATTARASPLPDAVTLFSSFMAFTLRFLPLGERYASRGYQGLPRQFVTFALGPSVAGTLRALAECAPSARALQPLQHPQSHDECDRADRGHDQASEESGAAHDPHDPKKKPTEQDADDADDQVSDQTPVHPFP